MRKEGIFFGRTQLLADVMQREPANYVLVGGRQLGKSSLLRALERRYAHDPRVTCHYLMLGDAEISPALAQALGLPVDTPLPALLDALRQGQNGGRRLLLIDEADLFVAAEARQGYPTLRLFRSLIEALKCHSILV